MCGLEIFMNLQHMKYAIEIERARSVTIAAENLFLTQPQLSRNLSELEAELGIKLFDRTKGGMVPTEKGLEFLEKAREIVQSTNELVDMFKDSSSKVEKLGFSLPRTGYTKDAIKRIVGALNSAPTTQLVCDETDANTAIQNLLHNGHFAATIRTFRSTRNLAEEYLDKLGLEFRVLFKTNPVYLISQDDEDTHKWTSALIENRRRFELKECFVPELYIQDGVNTGQIILQQRSSLYRLIREQKNSYAITVPHPVASLARYNLVQMPCKDKRFEMCDLLVFKKKKKFTKMQTNLIKELEDEIECYKKVIDSLDIG